MNDGERLVDGQQVIKLHRKMEKIAVRLRIGK